MSLAVLIGSFQYPASNDSRGGNDTLPRVAISKTLFEKLAHIILKFIYPDHTGYAPSKKLI